MATLDTRLKAVENEITAALKLGKSLKSILQRTDVKEAAPFLRNLGTGHYGSDIRRNVEDYAAEIENSYTGAKRGKQIFDRKFREALGEFKSEIGMLLKNNTWMLLNSNITDLPKACKSLKKNSEVIPPVKCIGITENQKEGTLDYFAKQRNKCEYKVLNLSSYVKSVLDTIKIGQFIESELFKINVRYQKQIGAPPPQDAILKMEGYDYTNQDRNAADIAALFNRIDMRIPGENRDLAEKPKDYLFSPLTVRLDELGTVVQEIQTLAAKAFDNYNKICQIHQEAELNRSNRKLKIKYAPHGEGYREEFPAPAGLKMSDLI